jgi:hypothetical protein
VICPSLRFLPFAVLTAVLVGCQNIPTRRGTSVEASPNAKIEFVNPTDIAVLPVENATASKKIPAKELRAALESGLVLRRYSPLATDYVDSKVTEAAFQPGSLREDAVLRVSIESWDDRSWITHGAITLRLTARILDSKNGGELWSGRLDRRFDLGKDREHFTTEAPMRKLLCETIVSELFAALPARTAKPGRTP